MKKNFFLLSFLTITLFFGECFGAENSGIIHFLETVIIDFPADIQIKQGGANHYQIEGSSSALKNLKVIIRGGKLIFEKRKFETKNSPIEPIKIELTVKKLHEIIAKGEVKLDLEGLRGPKLSMQTDGSCKIQGIELDIIELGASFKGSTQATLSGKIKEQEYFAKGDFNVDAQDVQSKIVSIKAQGEGNFFISVTEKLWVDLAGKILCDYKGTPSSVDFLLLGDSKLTQK